MLGRDKTGSLIKKRGMAGGKRLEWKEWNEIKRGKVKREERV